MLKNTLKQFARGLKLHISALYLASKDPAVPEMAKWLGIAVVADALSPVDLIPDFIPLFSCAYVCCLVTVLSMNIPKHL